MNVALVMTVIGPDRPGLVETVASVVAAHGGNWLDSRMSRLGGQFAGILRVQVPSEEEATLARELRSLKARGLTVVIETDRVVAEQDPQRSMILELVGQDRPGIVQQISRVLAGRGINVTEFTSECVSAAMSGEVLFRARATVDLPPACDLEGLQRDLERIAADLIVDVDLAPLPPPASAAAPN